MIQDAAERAAGTFKIEVEGIGFDTSPRRGNGSVVMAQ
jgi:hypothetical protein